MHVSDKYSLRHLDDKEAVKSTRGTGNNPNKFILNSGRMSAQLKNLNATQNFWKSNNSLANNSAVQIS